MLRLLIDSAGSTALLALARETTFLTHVEVAPQIGEDRVGVFLDALQGLLSENRVDLADLQAIFAVNGPGRYTGIRLGLSMVEGLRIGSSMAVCGLRRDRAYAELMSGASGVFLCDSGKAVAYGGVWQEGKVDRLDSLNQARACRLFASHPALLALLPEDRLLQHYPDLCRKVGAWRVPTLTERARAFASVSARIAEFSAKDYSLQPWYVTAAVAGD